MNQRAASRLNQMVVIVIIVLRAFPSVLRVCDIYAQPITTSLIGVKCVVAAVTAVQLSNAANAKPAELSLIQN